MAGNSYFVDIEPGTDEVLDDGPWPDRLSRLLSRRRVRVAVVLACGLMSVSTFGGTRVYEQVAAPAHSVAPGVTPAVTTAPGVAALPLDDSVCSDETTYVEDPNHPGVRPFELTFCPPVAPAPLPPRHANGHHLR